MFNNQPHQSVMAWISRGSELHVHHPQLCGHHLSVETLLSAGFCQDQYDRGQQLLQALAPEHRNDVHAWTREFLQSKPNDLNGMGLLQGSLFALDDDGTKLILDHQGHCIARHNRQGSFTAGRYEFEIYQAEGYAVRGSDTLKTAKVGESELSLLSVYELTAMLASAIMLALSNTRLVLDGKDPNALQAPEGSQALVDVGLFGSIKVLWADELIANQIQELGLADVFDALASVSPGRYACHFSTYYEAIDEHSSATCPVSELHSFRLLARDYTLVKPFLDTPPKHWQRWRTETVYQEIGEGIPAALEMIECCDVQLRSGDILHSVSPSDMNWGVFGQGTIELFRIRPCPYNKLDTQLLQLFEHCLAAFLDRTPFVDINTDYDRSGDWITQIEDTKLGKTILSVQAVRKSAMHQQVIQRLLFITPD